MYLQIFNLVYFLAFSILGFLSLFNLILVVLFLLLSLLRTTKYKDSQRSLSIVIPAYNEETNIGNCLDSILASDYDMGKIEIICVDDSSNDGTPEVIKEYAAKYKNIKLFKGRHQGKAEALNLGIKNAKKDLVLTLDADMRLEPGYLGQIVAPFDDPSVGYSLGLTLVSHSKNLLAAYQAIEYYYMNLMKFITTKLFAFPVWFSGQAGCFRRQALADCGGFNNDTLTEDFDLTLNLYPKYKAVFLRSAVAYTKPLENPASLLKQRMRWYFGGIQNLFKNRKKIKFSYPIIIYVYFSYLLWILNSIIIFPLFLFSFASTLVFYPSSTLLLWLSSSTVLAPFYALYVLKGSTVTITQLTYVIIGLILVVMYEVSLIVSNSKINIRLLFAFFTFFTYMSFLQGSLIASLFKYHTLERKSFIKES